MAGLRDVFSRRVLFVLIFTVLVCLLGVVHFGDVLTPTVTLKPWIHDSQFLKVVEDREQGKETLKNAGRLDLRLAPLVNGSDVKGAESPVVGAPELKQTPVVNGSDAKGAASPVVGAPELKQTPVVNGSDVKGAESPVIGAQELKQTSLQDGSDVKRAASPVVGAPDLKQTSVVNGSDVKGAADSIVSVPTAVPPAQLVAPTEPCPENPPIQETTVPLQLTEVTSEQLIKELGQVLQHGGHYAPPTCVARERVALIIPYRNRESNLIIMLRNLVPFLIKQQTEFTIFVVEQTEDYLFNRCLMFNVGYNETKRGDDFTCFILHDTDLIPRDYRNIYRCSDKPRHFTTIRSNEHTHFMERLPYRSFIGGVIGLRKQHMESSNGCSNLYFGWGLEDDDLEIRLKSTGNSVVRPPMEIGHYYSLGHKAQEHSNSSRGKLHKSIYHRWRSEGLNTLSYTMLKREQLPLYTHFLVKPPPPPADYYAENERV